MNEVMDITPISFRAKVRVVAPSSTFNRSLFNYGVNFLKSSKLKPVYSKEIFSNYHYLAGTDERRADELLEAFTDKEAEAIWTARGGYGAIRILPELKRNKDRIIKNQKWFIGFSDVTVLHSFFVEQCGLVTIYGPNITTFQSLNNTAKSHIIDLLEGKEKAYKTHNRHIDVIQPGKASGTVKGGNLTSLVSLMGTEFEPNFDDAILFMEDINEPPYKIDRMLTQMRLAGKFKKLKGVILGGFYYKERPRVMKSINPNFIVERMGIPSSVPVMANFPTGHPLGEQGGRKVSFVTSDMEDNTKSPFVSLLLGAVATMDTERKTLDYLA